MANMRTIAKLAGVSIFTVSLALRDDPRIRPETRAKVKEIAEICHYRPNRMAQAAITGKSNAVGVIIQRVDSPFHSRIFRGIMEEAYAQSYHALIMESMDDYARTQRSISALIEQRVEGIIIDANVALPISSEDYFALRSHDIVPIFIDISCGPVATDLVRTDERALAELATGYLHDMGHRAIGYIATNSVERTERIRQAMVQVKLPTQYFYNADDQPVADIVREVVQSRPRLTALIAAYDDLALEVIRHLSHHGLTVPRDMSVIGCTNTDLIAFLVPALTSIEQDPEEIGRQAMRLCLQRITEGKDLLEITPKTHLVAPRLIVRESCCPPQHARQSV